MKIVVVPNDLRDEINEKLDAAIAEVPEAEADREELFRAVLSYYDEHGVVPPFTLGRKDQPI